MRNADKTKEQFIAEVEAQRGRGVVGVEQIEQLFNASAEILLRRRGK